MTGWAFETLSATTLLMLVVLVLREPVARRFGAAAAYLLWLAPALRMLLPPLPADWFGARDDAVGTVVTLLDSAAIADGGVAASALPASPWALLAVVIWLGGAGLFFLWHWFRYDRFARRARHSADWLYAEESIEIASSSAIDSPIAFGIFGKVVMIPTDFATRYNPLEQRLALAHEVAHHRRHDLPVNLAALVMLSLHWFNPVAHWAHRAFRIDQEAACDAQVLCGASPRERHAYGTALFKSATAGTPLAACAMGAATTVKARLLRIVSGGPKAATSPMLTGMVAALGAVVLLTASTAIVARSAGMTPAQAPILVLGGGTLVPPGPAAPNPSPVVPLVKAVAPLAPAPPQPVALPKNNDEAADLQSPEVPAPPALPSSQSAELPSAPALVMAIHARNMACASGTSPQFLSSASIVEGQRRKEIRIVLCKTAADAHASQSVRDALMNARNDITRDQVIGAVMRDRLLAAIDRQITETGRRHAGQGPVPLYSLQ